MIEDADMMRTNASLALGLLIALSGDATALVLCQKKASVAARESCRPSETPLSLVGLAEPGEPGAAGAQGPAGEAPLHLVDAAGNDVGPVVTLEFFLPSIIDPSLPVQSALVRDPPLTDGALLGVGVAGIPVGKVRYVSFDCTGEPLLEPTGVIAELQVIGDTVFAPNDVGSPVLASSVETNAASLGCESTTPRGGCCHIDTVFGTLGVARPVTTLTALGIVPPLRAVAK